MTYRFEITEPEEIRYRGLSVEREREWIAARWPSALPQRPQSRAWVWERFIVVLALTGVCVAFWAWVIWMIFYR
jgi:hypothetical protein